MKISLINFDLSRCRCVILETVGSGMFRGKLLCTGKFDDRIPEKEIVLQLDLTLHCLPLFYVV